MSYRCQALQLLVVIIMDLSNQIEALLIHTVLVGESGESTRKRLWHENSVTDIYLFFPL